MSNRYTALSDLGGAALGHRSEVDEVKARFNIENNYLDAWIYGFLENKKFNIEETVAKLHRRFDMEINELATYEFTDQMRETLSKGIIQEIGEDKLGRSVFLVTSKRENYSGSLLEEQRKIFDMSICLGTRLRETNHRCQMVMLINQEGANILKGDLTTLATRVAKYYPGGVDKMFVCKMSRMTAAVAKPVFKRMPAIVSDRLVVVDDSDLKKGVLKDIIPEDVLPVQFGGKNDCDNEEHWVAYAQRVEKFFSEMKAAIQSGLSVKEWELQQLGLLQREKSGQQVPNRTSVTPSAQPSMTAVSFTGGEEKGPKSFSAVSQNSDYAATLKTCESEGPATVSMRTAHSPFYHQPYGGKDDEEEEEVGMTWLEIIEPLPKSLALFFLDELLRWRDEIVEQEDVERYKLFEEFGRTLYSIAIRDGGMQFDLEDKHWYYGVPYPLRSLLHLILQFITLMNVAYFVGATVFISVFCATVIVTLFFGAFISYNYFFPIFAVLLMSMIQSVSLCSRATEIISAIMNGEVIPLLRPFKRIGMIVQLTLFFVVVTVQFIIFIIYAKQKSPLQGLQISFATGWLSATFIVAVTHAFYFTGYFDSARNTENKLMALPLFLAMNVSREKKSKVADKLLLRTSSAILCGVPLTISMLLGIGFLISRIVALYICTIVAALVAAFTVSYYSKAMGTLLSGTLLRLTLWMTTVNWLYVVFAFGFTNYSGKWGVIVILSMSINGCLVILSLFSMQGNASSLYLKIIFIITLAFILGCWICCFPIIGYKIGLFCLALMVHNIIGIVFSTQSMSTMSGVFFATIGPLLLSIACILLGWYGTTVQYATPQSLPRTSPTLQTLTNFELYHRYPVCTLKLGDTDRLSIIDVALLTEIVKAESPALFNNDFNNWFSGTSITYDSYVGSIGADVSTWDMHRFSGDGWTFLVINNEHATSSIIGTTEWIASIALSPLSIFLPYYWTQTVVYVMSFVPSTLLDFGWNNLIDTLSEAVQKEVATATGTVVVTGSGFAGGLASIAAVKAKVDSIVFSSPGVLHLERVIDISHDDFYKYIFQVGAADGVLDCIGGRDAPTAQKLKCDGDAMYCMSHMYISRELIRACGDQYGRQHK